MKYPWYSWLSIFGFMVQFARGAICILFEKRPFDFSLWIRFFGMFFVLFLGLMILPIVVLTLLMAAFEGNMVMYYIVNGLIFVVLYVMGVLSTRKLYKWSQLHIKSER